MTNGLMRVLNSTMECKVDCFLSFYFFFFASRNAGSVIVNGICNFFLELEPTEFDIL